MSKITYAIVEPTSARDHVFADGYPTREAAEQAAESAGVIWYRGYRIVEHHAHDCGCERCSRARSQDPWERQLAAMAA